MSLEDIKSEPKEREARGKILGKRGKVNVWITRIVYDYNHWMCGIDMDDKNISYYNLDLCFHRTWVTMFIHLLYMIILNSYICYVIH